MQSILMIERAQSLRKTGQFQNSLQSITSMTISSFCDPEQRISQTCHRDMQDAFFFLHDPYHFFQEIESFQYSSYS